MMPRVIEKWNAMTVAASKDDLAIAASCDQKDFPLSESFIICAYSKITAV